MGDGEGDSSHLRSLGRIYGQVSVRICELFIANEMIAEVWECSQMRWISRICEAQFGVPESIIADSATNLNNDMLKAMCETFKIKHQNSTAYTQQMNGVVESANKNIQKILRKMVDNYKATPYLLVSGTKVVIPAEVEIPSLSIIQEAELSDVEWVQSRYNPLAVIDSKRMNPVCHVQLYQNRWQGISTRRFDRGNSYWGNWC
nr:uncharacterized protein LOC104121408 [Nicotiana tomentosiformis]